MITNWIKSILGSSKSQQPKIVAKSVEPTDQEKQIAITRLDKMARLAVFGQIGGVRPQKDNRTKSWWGGNFVGIQGEKIPACNKSGRHMHPVLQIRVDELPEIPSAFEGLALINIWMDLQATTFWGAKNGDGFQVRAYADIENLVPLGFGFNESTELPTFPVLWKTKALEQPSWEDMAGEVPPNVARAMDSGWFFESNYAASVDKFRDGNPIKLGGWPAWIQGSDWPKDAEYFFQVDSNDKGKLYLGDAGSFYIFRTLEGWEIRGDCY